MGFNSHKGTLGHSIGKSIIGKDNDAGKPNGEDSASQSMGFSHINIQPAANGLVVKHTPAMGPGAETKPENPSEEQTHIFRNAAEAHEHLGTLLGLKLGSGAQRD